MRKIVIAVAAVSLLLTAACDKDKDPTKPKASKTAAAQAPAIVPPPAGGGERPPPLPDADRPGPQADPNACNATERSLELYAHWVSEIEATPTIRWSKNGVWTPATNVISLRNRPGMIPYSGEWSTLQTAKCHDVFVVEMKGTRSMTHGMCAIIDLGDGPVKTGQRNCTVTYTAV